MNFLVEPLLVGTYCALLSRVVNQPFVFGMVKHALGYVAGLHAWFCRTRNAGSSATVTWGRLASESVFEGFAVLALCSMLGRSALAYFIIGILLHIGSELSGFHLEFLRRCHL